MNYAVVYEVEDDECDDVCAGSDYSGGKVI